MPRATAAHLARGLFESPKDAPTRAGFGEGLIAAGARDEGIVARSAAGAMAGKDTAGYADRIDPCVERGRAALDDGAI